MSNASAIDYNDVCGKRHCVSCRGEEFGARSRYLRQGQVIVSHGIQSIHVRSYATRKENNTFRFIIWNDYQIKYLKYITLDIAKKASKETLAYNYHVCKITESGTWFIKDNMLTFFQKFGPWAISAVTQTQSIKFSFTLLCTSQWRHTNFILYENHPRFDCLFNSLLKLTLKNLSKVRMIGSS